MLHGGAVGNTSRTGSSTFPAAEYCCKIPAFGIEGKKAVDYFAYHDPDKMVNVNCKTCRNEIPSCATTCIVSDRQFTLISLC